MKRLIPLAALALAAFVALPTTAAPASHWRELNADLAPVNVKLRDDAGLFALALAQFGTDAQAIFFGSPFGNGAHNTASKVVKDVENIHKLMAALRADANKGIAILDSYAPEKCSQHFVALEYSMFASWVTTMAELSANQPSGAASAAIWLSGLNPRDLTPLLSGGPTDIAWSQTKCQGASPSPGPSTTAGSPTPS